MDVEKFKRDFKAALDADIESGEWQRRWDEAAERDRLKSIERTEHLLPCPCCGGKAVRYPGEYQRSNSVWENIRCEVCGLSTEGIYGELNSEDVWQRRTK